MASIPKDLISAARLAEEWGCTKRNINERLAGWGVKRYLGQQISRSECEAARARLGSSIQAEKSAKAWGKSPADVLGKPASKSAGKSRGKSANEPLPNVPSSVRSGARRRELDPEGDKSRSEAERLTAWLKYENEKLDFEERQKNLLPIEEVRKTFQAIGRIVATARENAHAQVAPLLIGKTDPSEIETILRHEWRAIDDRVANEIQAKYGTVTVVTPETATAVNDNSDSGSNADSDADRS